MRWRGATALIVLGGAQAALWSAGLPARGAHAAFATRSALLFGLQLAAVAVAWNRRDRATVWIVLGFALVFRAAAFGWPPVLSTDLHRYVWDGWVQDSGRSPYLWAPADPELAALRDGAVWPAVNRPTAVTVYPPGAQIAFVALSRFGLDSVAGVKAAAGAAELLALVLLLVALRRRDLPAGRIALWAWSPLVVAEVWASGHVDALVLPLCLGALLLAERKRAGWAGLLLGAATLVKLYPALLLVAFPAGERRRAAAAAVGVAVLGYLPYVIISGPAVIGFLPDYVQVAEDFNAGARALLEAALVPLGAAARSTAAIASAGVLAAVLLAVARRRRDAAGRWDAAHDALLAWILLLPTAAHPWYVLPLGAVAVLRPSAAAIWIAGALPLSYLKYDAPGEILPLWVRWVEWLPAWAALGAAWALRPRAALPAAAPPGAARPPAVAAAPAPELAP